MLAPPGGIIGAEQFFKLGEGIAFGIAETAQDAQGNRVGLAALDGEDARAHTNLARKAGGKRFLGFTGLRAVAFDQHEVEAFVVIGEDEQVVAGTVAEGTDDALCGGHRDGFQLEEIDFEQAGVLAGEAFDMGDDVFQVVEAHGRDALEKAFVGVIVEMGEKGGECIPVGKLLDVFTGEFVICFEHALQPAILA